MREPGFFFEPLTDTEGTRNSDILPQIHKKRSVDKIELLQQKYDNHLKKRTLIFNESFDDQEQMIRINDYNNDLYWIFFPLLKLELLKAERNNFRDIISSPLIELQYYLEASKRIDEYMNLPEYSAVVVLSIKAITVYYSYFITQVQKYLALVESNNGHGLIESLKSELSDAEETKSSLDIKLKEYKISEISQERSSKFDEVANYSVFLEYMKSLSKFATRLKALKAQNLDAILSSPSIV